MKTKLILNSGGIRNNLKLRKKFHQEMIRGFSESQINILICSFAQPREYWEQKFSGYSASIKEDLPEYNLNFNLAMPDTFEEQIKEADIIYFNGGDDHLFGYWMDKFKFSIFNDKILATNSGSSDYISDSFWPNDWRKPMKGKGILPIKFMSHYGANPEIDWAKAEKQLAEFSNPDLPIFKLKEGEYVVFEEDNEGVLKKVKTVTGA